MPKFSSGQLLTADYLNAFDMKVGRQNPTAILRSSGNDRSYIHVDGRVFAEEDGVWVEQISKDPAADVSGLRSLGTGGLQAASGIHQHDVKELTDDDLHGEPSVDIPSTWRWSISWTDFDISKSMLLLSTVRLAFRKASNAVLSTDLGIVLTATYGDVEVFSDDLAVFTNAELISSTVRSQLLTSVGIISEPAPSGIINFAGTGGDALVGSISDGVFKLCEFSTG